MPDTIIIVNGNVLIVGGECGGYTEPIPVIVTPSLVSTITEGQSAQIRITASNVQNQNILVDYATSNGTAIAGTDYTSTSGTATITPGNLTVDVSVPTTLRSGYQGNRAFNFTLSNARLADSTALTIAEAVEVITINETEQPGGGAVLPTISIESGVATEGAAVTFTVRLSGTHTENITFDYVTANGTALSGTDYTAASSSGTITAGQLTTTFTVNTSARTGYQASRSFTVTISNAETTSAESVSITTATATGTILDTDAPTGSNGFFDTQVARGEHLFSYPLRTSENLALIEGNDNAQTQYFTVPGGADEHPQAREGTKIVMPFSLSTAEQIRIPLSSYNLTDGKVLFGFDFFFTDDFYYNINPVDGTQHKWVNIMDGGDNGSGDSIYCEPRCTYGPVARWTYPQLCKRDVRTYGQGSNEDYLGTLGEYGVRRNTGYDPTGQGAEPLDSVINSVGVQVRHWFEFQLSQPGTAFTEFNAEYNTSGNPLGTRNITGTPTYGAVNQHQTIDCSEIKPTTVFTLTFNGQTTASITQPDIVTNGAANIQAALEALSNIAPGDVTVTQHPYVHGFYRFNVEFKGTYAGVNQSLITASIVTGGASTVPTVYQTLAAGSYTTIPVAANDYWHWRSKPSTRTTATITGHSNGSLNGVQSLFVKSPTELIVDGNLSGGAGGTVSMHYHMFSMWTWESSPGATLKTVYYRVPLVIRNTGKLLTFGLEMNTSDKVTAVRHEDMLTIPSIANPTIINLPGHTFETGDRCCILQCSSIPKGQYRVTKIDADNISIPVNVTLAASFNATGPYANSYGAVTYPMVGYVKNIYALRNFTASTADTSAFAQPEDD